MHSETYTNQRQFISLMNDFNDLYTLLWYSYLSLKRNGHSALNQGKTRGLSVDDVILINAIDPAKGSTVQALAQRANRDIASVSRQISTLCTHGWLVKRRGKADGRERLVGLTDRALAMLQEAQKQVDNVYSVMTSKLSLTEQKELFRMLRTIIEP